MGETRVPYEGLGDRVRHARVRRGLTREQIATQAGMSWSGIAQIESGRRRNVRPDTLAALARTLGVTTDYLVHGGTERAQTFSHRAVLYADDEEFVTAIGQLVVESVELTYPTRVITTEARVELLRAFLGKRAKRTDFRDADAFSGTPDAALGAVREFAERATARGAPWTHVVGDLSAASGFSTHSARWARFESIVNLALASLPLTMTCAYGRDAPPSILRIMRETHPETGPAGAPMAANSDYVDPGDYVIGRRV
jgi:transcriptional regulator with XRE-family HTH domain